MTKILTILIQPLVNAFKTVYKDGKLNINSLITIIILLSILGSFGYHEYTKADEDNIISKEEVVSIVKALESSEDTEQLNEDGGLK